MGNALIKNDYKSPDFANTWACVSDLLVINSKRDFKRATTVFNDLLDDNADEPSHKLHSYFLSISRAMTEWEELNEPPIRKLSAGEMIKSLMEAAGVKQKDLANIISQSSLSKVIHGDRDLTIPQIRGLCDYFDIAPNAFV